MSNEKIRKAQRRAEFESKAQDVLERRAGPLMEGFLDVVDDLAVEVAGLGDFAADARRALEFSYRLDRGLALPQPLETWDGPVAFLVALAVAGIYRAEVNRVGGLARKREVLAARLVAAEAEHRPAQAAALKARLAKVERKLADS